MSAANLTTTYTLRVDMNPDNLKTLDSVDPVLEVILKKGRYKVFLL